MGGDQQSVRRIRNHIRIGKWKWDWRWQRWQRWQRRSICWDAHGSTFCTRESHGRQRPKPGLGGGQKAATGDDGRVTAGPSPANADEIRSTSSYARVMENKDVKQKVDDIAAPIEHNYQSLIKQLRDRKAWVLW